MIYRAQRLMHSYNGHPAVEVDELAVPEGSRFAVVGRNGSGKTTLMEILVGLLKPTAGDVRFLDRPMLLPLTKELRSQVAYVAQQPFPIPGTVLSNVMLAIGTSRSRAEARRSALGWLERLGIERLANRHERTLSVGQLRLVSLARAAARSTPLLVLDEPFAFVDETFGRTLQEVLDEHNAAGGTIVMTSPQASAVSGWATHTLELG